MGIVKNLYDLRSGLISYVDKSGDHLESQGHAIDVKIAEPSSREIALAALKRNQIGETDFPTFCYEIARAGVYKWISDLFKATCRGNIRKCIIVIFAKVDMFRKTDTIKNHP